MASGVPWTSEQFEKLKDPTVYTNVCTKHIFGDWAPRDREMTTDVTRSVISAKKKYTRKEYRESCVEVGFEWHVLHLRFLQSVSRGDRRATVA